MIQWVFPFKEVAILLKIKINSFVSLQVVFHCFENWVIGKLEIV